MKAIQIALYSTGIKKGLSISNKRFVDYKFDISTLLQSRNWQGLLRLCSAESNDERKIIASILAMFNPKGVALFVNYVSSLPVHERKEWKNGVSTVCLVLGRLPEEGYPIEQRLRKLRLFLTDDHVQLSPVISALSNIWVLDSRTAARALFISWVLKGKENEDLQRAAVLSSAYLSKEAPESTLQFLRKAAWLEDKSYSAASLAAKEVARTSLPLRLQSSVLDSRPKRKKTKALKPLRASR